MLLACVFLPIAWAAPKAAPDLQAQASLLAGQALTSSVGWDRLVALTDEVGSRLSGSPGLDEAIRRTSAWMVADGLTVHSEPVWVPHWERGETSISLTAPRALRLDAATLGGSPGATGVEAEVVVVSTFGELKAAASRVPGRIVLYDEVWESYGQAVEYRWRGPLEAQRLGAVGALLRSPAPEGLSTPHTGSMSAEVTIPAAALTLEDARMIHRLADRGVPVKVRMDLGARSLPDASSANVVGEVRGREKPDEVVVLGCHLDSWDTGPGAQDDASGCVAVMEAGRLLAKSSPRRTVRIVLFTNEENGGRGAKAYGEAHGKERIVAGFELDIGAGAASKLVVSRRDPATGKPDVTTEARWTEALKPCLPLFRPLGIEAVETGAWASDLGPLVTRGLPLVGFSQDTTGYWPIHHTQADTVDRIDRPTWQRLVAATTLVAWITAEMPEVP